MAEWLMYEFLTSWQFLVTFVLASPATIACRHIPEVRCRAAIFVGLRTAWRGLMICEIVISIAFFADSRRSHGIKGMFAETC